MSSPPFIYSSPLPTQLVALSDRLSTSLRRPTLTVEPGLFTIACRATRYFPLKVPSSSIVPGSTFSPTFIVKSNYGLITVNPTGIFESVPKVPLKIMHASARTSPLYKGTPTVVAHALSVTSAQPTSVSSSISPEQSSPGTFVSGQVACSLASVVSAMTCLDIY